MTRRWSGAGVPLKLALGAALLVAAAACAGAGNPTTSPATTAGPPEPWAGTLEGFYVVPDPLPEGQPGELIRVMPVSSNDAETTVRVMYHSRDSQGADRAVTGIITHPDGDAPDEGWPVVSWAHGTTGLAAPCAPSRAGHSAPDFGVEAVRVATDYIGLGPEGERHSYLVGSSEAHSVIDIVRAARNLPDAHAGTRWVAVGHSQGGHSALFTNQLGQNYAPELEHLGTASLAPAAMFEERYGPDDTIVPHMVGAMAAYGIAAEYPGLDVGDYISDQVDAADEVIDTGCLDDIVAALAGIPIDQFWETDPYTTEPAISIIRENDPGKVAAEAPLLLAYGDIDTWVVPARVEALFDRLCSVGQVTELAEIPETGHEISPAMRDAVARFLAERLEGAPPTDSCAGA